MLAPALMGNLTESYHRLTDDQIDDFCDHVQGYINYIRDGDLIERD